MRGYDNKKCLFCSRGAGACVALRWNAEPAPEEDRVRLSVTVDSSVATYACALHVRDLFAGQGGDTAALERLYKSLVEETNRLIDALDKSQSGTEG